MPLSRSPSKEARQKNIETEIKSGRDPAQAVAIAYSVQEKNRRDQHKAAKGRERMKGKR